MTGSKDHSVRVWDCSIEEQSANTHVEPSSAQVSQTYIENAIGITSFAQSVVKEGDTTMLCVATAAGTLTYLHLQHAGWKFNNIGHTAAAHAD